MEALRIALVGVLTIACSTTPRPVSPPPVPTPPPDAAAVEDAAVAAAATADPCAEGRLHDAIALLGVDHVLADTRMGELHRPHDRVIELAGLFPVLQRDGNHVLAVANTDVLPGALVALLTPSGVAADPGRQVTGPALAILTCRPGEGYTFAARPFSLGTEARMQLLSVRPTRLPDGAHGVTATIAAFVSNGDWHATAYLLGVSTPNLPVRLPRAATVGVVAVVGAVGERTYIEGSHEARTVSPIDATGWYPVVDHDEQVFVRVARERTPAPDGTWTDFLRVAQLARLGAQGLTSAVGGVPNGAWFLAGTVIEPAWCRENTSIRCGRFTIDGDVITDGTFGFAWMGGAWPTTGEPPRSVTAPGARWLYVGQWEGAGPPRDPSRQVPLTEIRVQPVPAAH